MCLKGREGSCGVHLEEEEEEEGEEVVHMDA